MPLRDENGQRYLDRHVPCPGGRFAQRFPVASRRTLLAMTDRVFALLRSTTMALESVVTGAVPQRAIATVAARSSFCAMNGSAIIACLSSGRASQRLTLGGLAMQVLKHAGLSKGLPLCSA
jgi:hypothetical protein